MMFVFYFFFYFFFFFFSQLYFNFFFFFSSRRRHTRSLCDWSSDVCSSDLGSGSPCAWRTRDPVAAAGQDRKSTRLNSSHTVISYAVFCWKKKSDDTSAQ